MGYICYDVRCINCGEAFYETTELYDPNKMTTGEMLRFKKKYGPEGYNWSLPFSDHDMSEGIVCVECGGPLAPSGKIKVEPLNEESLGVRREARGVEEETEERPVRDLSGTAILTMQAAALKISPEEYERRIKAGEDFYEKAKIIDQAVINETNQSEGSQEPEEADDSIPNYLKQENCPECGKFFNAGEPWERHLASHTPEVRAQILKKIEPVIEKQPTMPAKPLAEAQIGGLLSDSQKGTKKGKGLGKFLKGAVRFQTEITPNEPDEVSGISCPLCEATFGKDKQGDFDAHLKTHDLGSVQQAIQQ